MCLIVDKKRTEEFLKACGETLTFFKAFIITDNPSVTLPKMLAAPYMYFNFPGPKEYVERWILRELIDQEHIGGKVFHAYSDKSLANGYEGEILLEIQVKKKDFIALDKDGSVCFKVFTIPKEEWEKVIQPV
jgi:hypothetical protein